MSDRGIKVTDKRMFNAEGVLRDEYRELENASAPSESTPPAATMEPPPSPAAASEPTPGEAAAPLFEAAGAFDQPGEVDDDTDADDADAMSGPTLELPGAPPGMGPTFYDLVQELVNPAAVYLGEVPLPDGQNAENLEAARFYIDLLDLLKQRTVGNVTVQEAGYLDEILYRLRVRYVQKRG